MKWPVQKWRVLRYFCQFWVIFVSNFIDWQHFIWSVSSLAFRCSKVSVLLKIGFRIDTVTILEVIALLLCH